MTRLGTGVSPVQGFGIELIITFILVSTVFATCDKHRTSLNGSGPLAIGLSVTMCHLSFVSILQSILNNCCRILFWCEYFNSIWYILQIRLTGASMNPARTFGPAVVTGWWQNHWIYWCGPIGGGVLAGLLYEFVFAGNRRNT